MLLAQEGSGLGGEGGRVRSIWRCLSTGVEVGKVCVWGQLAGGASSDKSERPGGSHRRGSRQRGRSEIGGFLVGRNRGMGRRFAGFGGMRRFSRMIGVRLVGVPGAVAGLELPVQSRGTYLHSLPVGLQAVFELLEELLFHAHVVVSDCQDGDSVRARGLIGAVAFDPAMSAEEFLLKEDERRLGVLQCALVSPDL